jgi:nickel/cobalt exporter
MHRRILPLLAATFAVAHPMGNFSVSHYTRFAIDGDRADVTYILDLAETPSYRLFKDWQVEAKSPQAVLEAKAAEQARQWMAGLEFRSGEKVLDPSLVRSEIKVSDAGGGLTTVRISSMLRIDGVNGRLEFEDRNYRDREGWKEILVPGDADRTNALTFYPPIAPLQELHAEIEWNAAGKVTKKIISVEQIKPAEPQPTTPARTDYLSRLLGNKDISVGLMLAGIAVAFAFGAMHALSPGHGKTIVAAYLVGSRGTMRHAVFLGAMVTFTHTISVFALGIATYFLSRYVVPEKIIPVLGAISGLSIVAIGASLFWKRLRRLNSHHHDHHHHHHHDLDHAHPHTHTHDGHTHTHVPEGDISMGSLIALGASGGLVPCPSALVLLLSSIALGHIGAGLVLLVAFSVGLAGVLMSIGMLVLYAKQWIPDPEKASRHPAFRLVPVLSAAVIVCLGLVMTGVSLGWVNPGRFIG